MLLSIRNIAEGKGTDLDVVELRKKLADTEEEVNSIISSLDHGWNEIVQRPDGLKIANEIGDLIYSKVGKMGIRHDIDVLLRCDPQDPEAIEGAGGLLKNIMEFNERLLRLHQEVLKPAAKLYNQ